MVDVDGLDIASAAERFEQGGGHGPVLLRIPPETLLSLDAAALRTFGGRRTEAGDLAGTLRQFRRPLEWRDATGARRTSVAAAIPVILPGSSERRMLLMAEWARHLPGGGRLWLATTRNVPLTELPRLTLPAERVDRDFAEVSDRVGVRDFAGRSFPGWHRHITLASVAHFAAVLGDSARGLARSGAG